MLATTSCKSSRAFACRTTLRCTAARLSLRTPLESVDFHSIVVLDRTGMMAQVYHEARNRILIFALGTLLLVAAGAVWQFTVRLAQAEGKTRVLQAETRHLRELGQAAAGLAHETRNPLGLIRGWTQRLVKAGLPSEEQQEQAEAVLEECDRVTARINQFLAFARQAEVNIESVVVERPCPGTTHAAAVRPGCRRLEVGNDSPQYSQLPFRPIGTN